jgi:hypothetical protein
MLAPMICARWPNTVRWPIRTGSSGVPTTTPFSSTAEWLPIDTVPSWRARTTRPWANTAPAPTWTGPTRRAEPAICGAGWSGQARLRLTETSPTSC